MLPDTVKRRHPRHRAEELAVSGVPTGLEVGPRETLGRLREGTPPREES